MAEAQPRLLRTRSLDLRWIIASLFTKEPLTLNKRCVFQYFGVSFSN
jgi:hypothetical protein